MSLVAELKRRNVFRVGAAYLALAWVVVQITATVVPEFNLHFLVAAIAVTALDRFTRARPAEPVGAGHARDSGTERAPGVDQHDLQAAEDRGHGPLPQVAPTAAAPDAKSIAVLPFVNMRSDKAPEQLAAIRFDVQVPKS